MNPDGGPGAGPSGGTPGSIPEIAPKVSPGQWVAYAATRAVFASARVLPLFLGAGLARAAGWAAYAASPKYRRRMREAIGQSLGLDAPEARRVARRVFPHFALAAVEWAKISGRPPAEAERHFAPDDDREALERLVAGERQAGRGVIFVTGHLGVWELSGMVCAGRGWLSGSVARPLANPPMDRWVNRLRGAAGQRVWAKRGALRGVLRALREGRGAGFVADQDGGRRGAPAPFFGRVASTMAAPVDLAMRTGSPLVVGAVVRDGRPMRFRLRAAWPELRADPGAPDPARERSRLLAAMNQGLERLIAGDPGQWMWTHRRWRTQWAGDAPY